MESRTASLQKRAAIENRHLALINCFAKATWIALGLALVCLSVDAYAIFDLPHHLVSAGGMHGVTPFSVWLWILEIALAVVALMLVWFAFSQPPRLDRQP